MTEKTLFLFDGPVSPAARLILAHGAGAPMDSEFMNDIAGLLAARGVGVARFEFPYMAGRREGGKKKPPDREPALRDAWLRAIAELADGTPLYIGGKSLGGRIASLVAADQREEMATDAKLAGVICLGYPFHPPGKPEKTRTAHLADMQVATLICQGERDPFGTPQDVADYALSKEVRLTWLPDGDHSLKPRKKSGHTLEENMETAAAAIAGFIEETLPRHGA